MSITEIVVSVLIGSFVGVIIGLAFHEHILFCRKTRAETKLYDALRIFVEDVPAVYIRGDLSMRSLYYGKKD